MQDEIIRNKLSNLNEKRNSNNLKLFYPILLLTNYETKHENEKTIQASPKWGKRGVGAVIPLALY